MKIISEHDKMLGADIVAVVDKALKRGVEAHQVAMSLIGFGVGTLLSIGVPPDTVSAALVKLIADADAEFRKQGTTGAPPS